MMKGEVEERQSVNKEEKKGKKGKKSKGIGRMRWKKRGRKEEDRGREIVKMDEDSSEGWDDKEWDG